jgi:hypothetical protein
MLRIITIIAFTALAIITFFLNPIWAWVLTLLLELYISVVLLTAKIRYRYEVFSDLSDEANKLLQQYGHYFAMPFASRDFSASAAASQYGGILLAITSAINDFWLGILFAIINWFLMAYVSVSFSPLGLIQKNPVMQDAYDEIIRFNKERGA